MNERTFKGTDGLIFADVLSGQTLSKSRVVCPAVNSGHTHTHTLIKRVVAVFPFNNRWSVSDGLFLVMMSTSYIWFVCMIAN